MESDKMDKYLQKKPKYTEVETIDKVYARSLDKADKDQGKKSKKMEKMLIRDEEETKGIQMKESEDGVMTYFTGMGNYHQAIRYGSKPDISRRTRQHNLQFAREVLEAEGILTPDVDEAVKSSIEEIK